MVILRKILFPFAVLYGCITSIRNFLFDHKILKSYTFDIPVIAVGNLSVGGTGKTPQIEYLIRLLSDKYKIATLSRGYKRKSKGFVLANTNSDAEILGDEPFQFYAKFPQIKVAVDANRKNGIGELLQLDPKPEVILLDDAFQHRKVTAGFYIVLTSYEDLFYNDWMLPTGNLRESRSGVDRADMIIVTKCPQDISEIAQQEIVLNCKRYLTKNQPIFFSSIAYATTLYDADGKQTTEEIWDVNKLVVAGIAKPEPFFAYLQAEKNRTMVYPDHHDFTDKDIQFLLEKAKGRKIITTEKDFVRLKGKLPASQLFYLPITANLWSGSDEFDKKILEYVGTSTRNS